MNKQNIKMESLIILIGIIILSVGIYAYFKELDTKLLLTILAASLAILGIVGTTYLTFHYRAESQEKQNTIEGFTAANLIIADKLKSTTDNIEQFTAANLIVTNNVKNITQRVDTITQKTKTNTDKNLELTKLIDELSKRTFKKAKELQYPITDDFSISYRFSFKKEEYLKLIPPIGKRKSHIFSLSTPKEYEIPIDQIPENYPFRYSDVLTNYFKEIFAKGYIYVTIKKGNHRFHLEKSYNESDIFDKHNFNNANSNLPYRNPGALVSHSEDDDMFHFEFKDLPIRISLNTGNYASIFDLQDSEVIVKLSPYSDIQDVSFKSLWLKMGEQRVFAISNFKYNSEKDEYKSSDKVDLILK